MEKTRVFSFGKIDYYNTGRKINEVTLEVNLRDWNGYLEFTASADVWNMHHTDCVACGQMIDELYKEFPALHTVLYRIIKELWEKYHCKDISNIPQEDRDLIDKLIDKSVTKDAIINAYWQGRK